ncbi:unnamed protein product [Orchesella dallaii]|uniref:Ubiquitin-like protease family profile domain-containing protein n=1 Tax=Orchesella dallaii TaxID=48710 RepID=A0ABP1PI65_9HEXA
MKSLQQSVTLAENRILSKYLDNDYNGNSREWVVDTVISGFLMMISDAMRKGVISLTAQEAMHVFRENDSTLLFAKKWLYDKDYHDWTAISKILVPVLIGGDHWILVVLLPIFTEIQVLDPVACYKLTSRQKVILETLFNTKYSFNAGTLWKVTYPKASVSAGTDAIQCGPLICFYAEAISKGWSLEAFPGVDKYREHISSILIGSCSPLSLKQPKKCIHCQIAIKSEERCDFCHRFSHFNCLEKIFVRGRVYNVCKNQRDSHNASGTH